MILSPDKCFLELQELGGDSIILDLGEEAIVVGEDIIELGVVGIWGFLRECSRNDGERRESPPALAILFFRNLIR